MKGTRYWHGDLWCPVCEESIPYEAQSEPRTLDYPGDVEVELHLEQHIRCHITAEQRHKLVTLAMNYDGICDCAGHK